MAVVVHLSHSGKYYILVDFSFVYINLLTIFAKPSQKISSDNLRPLPDPNNEVRSAFAFEPGCTLKLMAHLFPVVITESS